MDDIGSRKVVHFARQKEYSEFTQNTEGKDNIHLKL